MVRGILALVLVLAACCPWAAGQECVEYDRRGISSLNQSQLPEPYPLYLMHDGVHGLLREYQLFDSWLLFRWGDMDGTTFHPRGFYKFDTASPRSSAALWGGTLTLLTADMEILCLDWSDPASPRIVSSLELRRRPFLMRLQDGIVYCLSTGGLFTIIDYTEPAAPVILSTIQIDRTLSTLAVAGDRCWVVEEETSYGGPYVWYDSRILTYDVSDPAAPNLVHTSDDKYRIFTIQHADGLLITTGREDWQSSNDYGGHLDIYEADGRPDALRHMVHLVNPNLPEVRKIGGPTIPASYHWDGYLAVLHEERLHVKRILRDADGVELEVVREVEGPSDSFRLRGYRDEILFGWSSLTNRMIIRPIQVDPHVDAHDLDPGSMIDAGLDAQGLLMVARELQPDGSRTDAVLPVSIDGTGRIEAGAPVWSGPAMTGSSPAFFDDFITTPTGIVDSRTGAPLHAWNRPGRHHRVGDRHLYVSANDTLRVFDLSDPTEPERTASLWIAGGPVVLDSADGLAWVATGDGLVVLDVADPGAPVFRAGRPVDRRLNRGVVRNGLLYAVSDHTLRSFDLADPFDPRDVGYLWCADSIEDFVISGDRVILATGEDGLYVVDVEDPLRPYPVNRLPMEGGVRRILHAGSHLLAGGDGVLRTLRPNCGDPVSIEPPSDGETPAAPLRTALAPPAPNPFNPSTELTFTLERPGPVTLTIHDAAGRRVRVLVDEARPAGKQSARWDGRDASGRAAPAGVYFARFSADGVSETRKLALVK